MRYHYRKDTKKLSSKNQQFKFAIAYVLH